MIEKNNTRPSVFPTPEQRAEAIRLADKAKIDAYEREKAVLTNDIYAQAAAPSDTPYGHLTAVEMMQKRAQQEMDIKRQGGVVRYPELAEKTENGPIKVVQDSLYSNSKNDEQIRLRDEQINKNNEQILAYQRQANEAMGRNNTNTILGLYPQAEIPQKPVQEEIKQPINHQQNNLGGGYVPPAPPSMNNNGYGDNYGKNPSNIDSYIFELSQPNYNSTYDVIPLPSEGRLNRGTPSSIKVGYMTTSDENILTSPNILESGRFLDILINRKILEPSLRYKDLHIGDRNAIMIWLRATGYGEMYPVTLFDENDVPFETEINLNELRTKKLGAEPDTEGLFDFQFPLCRARVKFRLMTCGDVDDIEKMVEMDKSRGVPLDNTSIYTMERVIVEVNGDRTRETIKAFANSIRIGDAKKFNEYVDSIESGIDLNIEVRTPGGGSIKTFLPLNLKFFWPNIKL